MSKNNIGLSGRGVITLDTVIGTVTDTDMQKHAGDDRIQLRTRLNLLTTSTIRNKTMKSMKVKKINNGKTKTKSKYNSNSTNNTNTNTHVSNNHALLFLKPNYTTKHIKYIIEEIFQYQNIKVLQSGIISTSEIITRELFKNQYSYILPTDEIYYNKYIVTNEDCKENETNFMDEAAVAMQLALENAKNLASSAQSVADASLDSASTAMSVMFEGVKSIGNKAVINAKAASESVSTADVLSKAGSMYTKAKDAAQVVTTKALHLVDDIVDVDLDDVKSMASNAKKIAASAKQKAIDFDAKDALEAASSKAKEAGAIATAAATSAAITAGQLSSKVTSNSNTTKNKNNLSIEVATGKDGTDGTMLLMCMRTRKIYRVSC